MKVVINNFKMPNNCKECPLRKNSNYCGAMQEVLEVSWWNRTYKVSTNSISKLKKKRDVRCPLKEEL